MRRTINAALCLLLIEVLWLSVERNEVNSPGQWKIMDTRISAGFPFQSISFTARQTSGDSQAALSTHPDDIRWWPGFWFSLLLLSLDFVAALAVFFGIRWLLEYQFARTIFLGLVMGVLFGVLINFGIRRLPRPGYIFEDPISWLNGFSVFIALPTAICFFTRHARWQKSILLLLTTLAIFPWASFWCDQFRPDRQFIGPTIERMILEPLLIGCLVIPVIFLMRKFLSSFTKPAAVS